VTRYVIDRHPRHRDLLCGRLGTTTRASLAIGRAPSGDYTQSHRTGVSYGVTVTPPQQTPSGLLRSPPPPDGEELGQNQLLPPGGAPGEAGRGGQRRFRW